MSAHDPALLHHCEDVWRVMRAEAHEEQHTDGVRYIWEGWTTKLFNRMHLSTPYYTHILRLLKAMDCIRQVQRGGGSAKSQWLLVQPPNLTLFNMATQSPTAPPAPGSGTANQRQMLQIMRDLSARIARLEAALGLEEDHVA